MMEIIFLGTACMQPTKTKNHSGILWRLKGENILLDCGEGIQRQIKIAGIKPAKITRLLISHWHGDHVLGVPGLMSTMGADQFAKKLQIYGPPGTKEYFKHIFKWFASKDIIDYEVQEVTSGVFFENEDFLLEAYSLYHAVPCLGYSLKIKDRLRINLEKAKKLGLLEGPLLGKLQQGETISFQGKKIIPEEATYGVKGKKISYIADTQPCFGANKLAQDADLLISEGTHLEDIKEKMERYTHLTVKEAALIASENNVKKLVLTHISQRYKSQAEIIKEARTYFDNTIIAEDFMKIKV